MLCCGWGRGRRGSRSAISSRICRVSFDLRIMGNQVDRRSCSVASGVSPSTSMLVMSVVRTVRVTQYHFKVSTAVSIV